MIGVFIFMGSRSGGLGFVLIFMDFLVGRQNIYKGIWHCNNKEELGEK